MVLQKFWFAAGKVDAPKREGTLYLWLYRCGLNVRLYAHIQSRSKATNIGYRLSWDAGYGY